MTGIPRYLGELIPRLAGKVSLLTPAKAIDGIRGHLWEQLVLPLELGGRVLFSPANTGPVLVARQVLTVHDLVPFDHPEWLNPRFARWVQMTSRPLLRRCRRIIAISEFTRSRIEAHFPDLDPRKIEVVHHGLGRQFVPSSQETVDRTLAELKIPSRRYVISVGSLEPRKNHARLMRIWTALSAEFAPDVWLVVVGARGAQRVFGDHRLDDANTAARIHFTGHVADAAIPPLYTGALGLAYLSLYEGWGFPAQEAMGCGTPVLCSNGSGLAEVTGDCGLRVDPTDDRAISEALRALVTDAPCRARLSAEGLRRAKRFDWDRTASRTWELLLEAAG